MLNKVEINKVDIFVKQDIADTYLIKEVVDIFEERARLNTTAAYSNEGCYREYLGEIDDSKVKKLQEQLLVSVQEVLVEAGLEHLQQIKAWVNVNEPGSCNEVHTHPLSVLAGCFYLQAEGTGELALIHPANHMMLAMVGDPTAQNTFIQPVDNSMVCFPSWYPHRVETNNSEINRVNIAFSVG